MIQVKQEEILEIERVELHVRHPRAYELHCKACAMVDQHNRCRQDDINSKKKLGMLYWSKRFNISFLSILNIDHCLAYSQGTENIL